MDLGIRDRAALVTGASKGSAAASRRRWRPRACGWRSRRGRLSVFRRQRAEIGARGYAFDARELDAVGPLVSQVEADVGPIDIYVANTGGPPAGADPLGFTREQWEEAHRTLVLSPMAFLERLLPGMRSRGFGRVVAIGSIAALEPIDALQLSNAHRPGLVTAFKVLARQAAADGVTLNHIHPGQSPPTASSATPAPARPPRRTPARRSGRPARHRRGDRSRGGVPVLGSRELHHGHVPARRRRPRAGGLLSTPSRIRTDDLRRERATS